MKHVVNFVVGTVVVGCGAGFVCGWFYAVSLFANWLAPDKPFAFLIAVVISVSGLGGVAFAIHEATPKKEASQ